jgi:undecaprenyl-diphosphatase
MKSIILGIVQGLTEFLPISSSGHLVLLKTLIGFDMPGVILEVSLHFGTLLSIIVYFRKRILSYLSKEKLPLIIFGTIPIVIIGIIFKRSIELMFSNPLLVFLMLFITGIILLLTLKRQKKGLLNLKNAFIIGVSQSFALIPGISRSGFTISTALLLGISKEESFEFSFILAIPALLGAFLLELTEIELFQVNYFKLLNGTIAAFLSGLLALWVFYKILRKKSLHYFTYYLWFVSVVGGLLFLFYRSHS